MTLSASLAPTSLAERMTFLHPWLTAVPLARWTFALKPGGLCARLIANQQVESRPTRR